MILAFIQTIENEGQRKIVEDIYDLYYKDMMAVAFKILNNYHDAQDAVQEAFYNISDTVDLFSVPNTPSTAALVHIYTRNTSINIYNKNKTFSKHIISMEDMDEEGFDVEDESQDFLKVIINNETTEMVSAAIESLDKMYHDVIILKYYYNMRNIDIAKLMNIDINTLNGRIFRAKIKLKEALKKVGYERISK